MPESVARRRIDWGVLGVEAGAIFLSVLLGFGVAEWRSARDADDRRRATLAAFVQEVGANRAELVERGAYHHWLSRAMDRGIASGEIRRFRDAFGLDGMTGFNPLALDRAAWATAEATGDLALVEFDTGRALWRVYDLQAEMDAEQTRLRALALDAVNDPDPSLPERFAFATREFTDLERTLLRRLDAADAALARDLGRPAPEPTPPDVFDRGAAAPR